MPWRACSVLAAFPEGTGALAMAGNLEQLFAHLDQLDGRADLEELTSVLRRLEISSDEVTPFIRFSERSYARNLMHSGPWYQAWILCWKNGQRSPIHDHV